MMRAATAQCWHCSPPRPADTDSSARSRSVPLSGGGRGVYSVLGPLHATHSGMISTRKCRYSQSIMSACQNQYDGGIIEQRPIQISKLMIWLHNRFNCDLYKDHVMVVILACAKVCTRLVTSPMVSMANYRAITQTGLSGCQDYSPEMWRKWHDFNILGRCIIFNFLGWQSAVTVVAQKQTSQYNYYYTYWIDTTNFLHLI